MAPNFSGKWKEYDNENFAAFLKARGIGMVKRKLAGSFKQTQEVEQSDTTIKVIGHMPVGGPLVQEVSLDGSEAEVATPEGSKVKCAITWDGEVMVMTMSDGVSIRRFFQGEEMHIQITYKEVTCTRKFRKT